MIDQFISNSPNMIMGTLFRESGAVILVIFSTINLLLVHDKKEGAFESLNLTMKHGV